MREKARKVIAITSNESMKGLADVLVRVKGGLVPRDAFPYLFLATLSVLGMKREIEEVKETVSATRFNGVQEISKDIMNFYIVIYSSGYMLPIAKRFKEQLNENSKVFAFLTELPEGFHNDVEPFFWRNDPFRAIVIGNDIWEEMASSIIPNAISIRPPLAGSKVREMISTLLLLDSISIELASITNVDRISLKGIPKARKIMKGFERKVIEKFESEEFEG
jgi:Bacterial phospho-glucose isomerase C-terminal region.